MTGLLLGGLLAYVCAGLLGAAAPPGRPAEGLVSRLATLLGLAGAAAFCALAVRGLGGAPLDLRLALGPPPFGLRLWAPPLSALFVLLISGVGALTSVYAEAYVGHLPPEQRRGVRLWTPLFLAAMTLVALAGDVVAFLMAWEAMSLTSYALVLTDGERPEVVRAGTIYLLLTHAGTLCLLGAFLLLANATGSMDFAVWSQAARALPGALRSGSFVLLLLGFGSKAALVPLHVWLPRAHPVAPSHVSGLMSGVMLKVAVYGLVLFACTILGPGPLWWGLLVLGLGLLSALLGVLYALMEHDLKRLLAYHSVENLGIITMGLGVALLAQHAHLPLLALVALVAALYHTINHALFKTALFLDAGSLQAAGAGRNLDAMGGLLRRMPWTGLSLLAAAASISGLPPFNGFVSEWLTYQSLVQLAAAGGPALALCAFAGLLGLALTGGLAAACFVKVGGLALLGSARTAAAGRAEEVPAAMYGPVAVLAGLCLLLGLLPGLIVPTLSAVAGAVLRSGAAPAAAGGALLLALPWGGARIGPAAFALAALAVCAAVTAVLAAGRRLRPRAAVAVPWACGQVLTPAGQYSATGYAKPFRQVFSLIYRPVRSVVVESVVHPFFRTQVRYEGGIVPVFDRYVYAPGLAGLLGLARRVRRLQSGSLRLYLGCILCTLILLLAFVR